jgi:hypothetical protein
LPTGSDLRQGQLPAQSNELMSERRVLRFKSAPQL